MMTDHSHNDTILLCEDALRAERKYNEENRILPSETTIASAMLSRTPELRDAYIDICNVLSADRRAVAVLLGLVLSCAAFRDPDDIDSIRKDARRLSELNAEIAHHASVLATKLRERTSMAERSSLDCGTRDHICDMIDDASTGNDHYCSFLHEELSLLRGQFDTKYWPWPEKVIDALAENARRTEVTPIGTMAEVGVRSPRRSKASFLRVLFREVEEAGKGPGGCLPSKRRLRDETFASLANVTLDICPSKSIDGSFVKRLRQQDRKT